MDTTTAQEILLGQIRTVLALIGGALVTHGVLNATTATEIAGVATALIPIAWSAWSKWQARARVAKAVNVGIVIADSTTGQTPLLPPTKAVELVATAGPLIREVAEGQAVPVVIPLAPGDLAAAIAAKKNPLPPGVARP